VPYNESNTMPLIAVGTTPTLINKTGLWRFLAPQRTERISPCSASCPLDSGVPRWMEKVKDGNWEGAWEIMEAYNPFPAITGHVCYRPCQEDCNRQYYDETIQIGEVEKAVGIWRHEYYQAPHFLPGKGENKKVAIVGAGPSGLSCAYYLNRLGIKVKVLEKLPLAGGLLATGIPEYRLPRELLTKELEILREEGIEILTGVEVGREMALEEILNNYDAVVLASGAQKSISPGIPGQELHGVVYALDFMREIHLQGRKNIEGPVVVMGGGNAALDAACEARLSGAREVFLVYRRERREMPAHPAEIRAAEEAGVEFIFQAIIDEIKGGGQVEKVRLLRTGPSQRGRELHLLEASASYLECRTVILAVGQETTLNDLAAMPPGYPKIDYAGDSDSYAVIKDAGETGGTILLAAGDAISGPGTVSGAIGGGRRAADFLAQHFSIKDDLTSPPPEKGERPVAFEELQTHYYIPQGIRSVPEEEAGRCFSCGWCSRCGVCWVFCPDIAVSLDDLEFEFVEEYCKGCGICARECPAGALRMEEVGRVER